MQQSYGAGPCTRGGICWGPRTLCKADRRRRGNYPLASRPTTICAPKRSTLPYFYPIATSRFLFSEPQEMGQNLTDSWHISGEWALQLNLNFIGSLRILATRWAAQAQPTSLTAFSGSASHCESVVTCACLQVNWKFYFDLRVLAQGPAYFFLSFVTILNPVSLPRSTVHSWVELKAGRSSAAVKCILL